MPDARTFRLPGGSADWLGVRSTALAMPALDQRHPGMRRRRQPPSPPGGRRNGSAVRFMSVANFICQFCTAVVHLKAVFP
jgi:hypothetical protein